MFTEIYWNCPKNAEILIPTLRVDLACWNLLDSTLPKSDYDVTIRIFRCCCGYPVHSHTIPLHRSSHQIKINASTIYEDERPTSSFQEDDIASYLEREGSQDAQDEHWSPARHTVTMPTDAFGCIDFRGNHTNKAQVIFFSTNFRSRFKNAASWYKSYFSLLEVIPH